MVRICSCAAASVLLVAASVYAAPKTDVVVLLNGDHFTGEVKQLSRGQLKLATDDAGTIYIEWENVASVKTAGRYDVAMRDGTRHVGALAPDTGGQLRIVAEDGTETPVTRLDVVSIASLKARFFERIDGSLDIGGSYTKSSAVGQLSIDLDAAYRRPSFEAFTDLSANLTRQHEPSSVTSRFVLKSGYTRFRADRWFVSPFAFVERNPDLGLTLRSAAVMVVGRYLQQSNRSTTLLAAGGAAGRERPIEGEPIPNFDLVAMFATSFFTYDFPKTGLDLSLMVFPEMNHRGRVRANADAKAKRELFKDFFPAITVYDTFDSQPQVPGFSRNDIGVTISIGWSF